MLLNNAHNGSQRYNVTVKGVIKKKNVPKTVAENYIMTLSETLQSVAILVPVTEDGSEILFG